MVWTPVVFAQKALVDQSDRGKVLKMLYPDLPAATKEASGAQPRGVTHKGELLKKLPDKLDKDGIKDALVDRIDVPLYAHNPLKGAANAPVTIVEFSDIGCQTCDDVFDEINTIVRKYPQHIRWVHKYASLNPFGGKSLAAFYSKIANKYDKFWPFRSALRKIKEPTKEDLVPALIDAGVEVRNMQNLIRLHAREIYRGLDADTVLNIKMGLKAPPAILVNGIVIGGAIPLEMFEDVVIYELERQDIAYQEEQNKKNGAQN